MDIGAYCFSPFWLDWPTTADEPLRNLDDQDTAVNFEYNRRLKFRKGSPFADTPGADPEIRGGNGRADFIGGDCRAMIHAKISNHAVESHFEALDRTNGPSERSAVQGRTACFSLWGGNLARNSA